MRNPRTLAGLRSAEGYIRRQLAHSINLRNTPEITFVLDQSIEYGVRMSKMIDDVTKDIPDRADEAEEETEEGRILMIFWQRFIRLPSADTSVPMVTVWAPALLLIITLKHGIPTLM